jgi:bifunctional DNA-binding transcriptional regulator/antitoxin component of YhaV-PrlF toxin-antitoxin module
MPPRGASGLPLDPAGPSPVAQDVVEVDERGRITLPASVLSATGWLAKREKADVLMRFDELGRIVLLSWEASGQAVLAKRRELLEDALEGDTAALDDLLMLEDRYHRARLARDHRVSLGVQGLLHLGLEEAARPPLGLEGAARGRVYVAGAADRVVIMSKEYRDKRLRRGAVALSDLP